MSEQAKMQKLEQSAAQFIGASAYVREPIQPTPEEIAEWRRKEEEQRKAYDEQQRKEHRKQLRDAFAMAALPGFLGQYVQAHPSDFEAIATDAYGLADDMLKARGDE